jgi:hypothetical protein
MLRIAVRRLTVGVRQLDRRIAQFWKRRPMLAPALTLLALVVWGGLHRELLFVTGMAAVGALSYSLGLTLGFSTSAIGTVVLFAVDRHDMGPAADAFASAVIQGLGFTLSAWMGYHHRRVQIAERRRTQPKSQHRPHVLPWAVANEIRTSLAAIRYLLFPVQGNPDSAALQRATNELARLEALFDEWDPDRIQRQSASPPAEHNDHRRKRTGGRSAFHR